MLVLARKQGEAIVIDGKTIFRILAIKNNQVRIGIEAPNDVAVYREEIQRLIDAKAKETDTVE